MSLPGLNVNLIYSARILRHPLLQKLITFFEVLEFLNLLLTFPNIPSKIKKIKTDNQPFNTGDMSVPPPYTHQPQVQNFSMPPPLHIQPQVAPSYSYYPTVSSYQPTPGFAYQHLPAAPVYSTPLAPHVSALLHTPPPTVVVGVAYNVPPHLSTASYPPPSPMPMSSYTASMSTPSSSLRLDSQQVSLNCSPKAPPV